MAEMTQKQMQKENKEETVEIPIGRLEKMEKEIKEIKRKWLLKEIEEGRKQIEKGRYEVVNPEVNQ